MQFLFDEVVQPWPWVFSRGGVLEEIPFLGPRYQTRVVRLYVEEPSNAYVITTSPEKENPREDWSFERPWEEVEGEDVQSEDAKDNDVGEVFGLSRIEQLRDHVMGLRDRKDCGWRLVLNPGGAFEWWP